MQDYVRNKLKKLIMQSLMYGKFPDYAFTTVTKYFSAFSFRITQFRILPTLIYRYGSMEQLLPLVYDDQS